jgi:hypothetical protein
MLLTDLHIHSRWSDGKHSIADIVDMYGQREFRVIAITDHVCETNSWMGLAAHWLNYSLTKDRFAAYQAEIATQAFRAWKEYRMLVLPGIEITKNALRTQRSAHILGIGVRDWVDPDQNIKDVLRAIRAQGGVTVAAHPVFANDPTFIPTLQLWQERSHLSELMDAWEVASGARLFDEVFQSGLPMLANSDLHHQSQIRSWKTLLASKCCEGAILRAIKNQDVSFAFYNGQALVSRLCLRVVMSSLQKFDKRARYLKNANL